MTPDDIIDLGELEFKSEDFDELNPLDWYVENPKEEVADFCNEKLRRVLSKAPKVWHVQDWEKHKLSDVWHPTGPSSLDTHEARLVCIKEIKETP